MSAKSVALILLLGTPLVFASDMQPPIPARPAGHMIDRPAGHMPPPLSILYQASKQSRDPQATAQELFKSIPAAEANKRYEVMISVRELPSQPSPIQPATAPLKGQ